MIEMTNYFNIFNKDADYETFKEGMEYVTPNICIVGNEKTISYKHHTPYLAFEAIEDTTFKLTQNACQYSLNNGGVWVDLPANTETPTVSAGSKIMFKKANPSISSSYGIGTFSSTGKFNVEGNIMSMLYGDDFIDKTDLNGKNYVFKGLFSGCTNVVEASNLILPATTLASNCYYHMFRGCTSLTNAPELPATTLASSCYYGMFYGCKLLTTAPELPATTLADNCYYNMFYNCSTLVNVPELPATTLASNCYYGMFYNCTSLNQITMLATDISASNCLKNWVSGVASTGTFIKHRVMSSLPTGVNGIPSGWTVQDYIAPISLCDIVYWDGSAVKTVSKDNWSTSLGTPIGVVVIPEGMLPDGKARIMGLKPVDNSGNQSSSHVGMVWGPYSIDTSLTNYTVVPITDNAGSTSTGSNNWGSLPSDISTGATSYVDSGAKYFGNPPYSPSPYLYNGGALTFNPEYSKAIEGNNALSDFNGLSNTETLVGLGTGYTAANAAWKYSDGVSNTQWYLPAAGELGFLMSRFNEINNTLTSVGGVAVDASFALWSSSEYSDWNAYNLATTTNDINNAMKVNPYYVRVFGVI